MYLKEIGLCTVLWHRTELGLSTPVLEYLGVIGLLASTMYRTVIGLLTIIMHQEKIVLLFVQKYLREIGLSTLVVEY